MDKLNCFSLTTEGHVAHLVMNRPEAMNTMHPTFWRELHEVLTDIHKAGTARALVISSTGKHFSAGMDLQTFGSAIQMDDTSARAVPALWMSVSTSCSSRQKVGCMVFIASGRFITRWAMWPSVVKEKQLSLSMVIHLGGWVGNGFTVRGPRCGHCPGLDQ